jgi:hypothetical protein
MQHTEALPVYWQHKRSHIIWQCHCNAVNCSTLQSVTGVAPYCPVDVASNAMRPGPSQAGEHVHCQQMCIMHGVSYYRHKPCAFAVK